MPVLPWNQSAAVHASKTAPIVSTSEALRSILLLAVAASACAYGTQYSSVLLLGLGSPGTKTTLALALWVASAVCAVGAVNVYYKWQASRGAKAAQEKLAAQQRKLFGLPPATPKTDLTKVRKPVIPAPAAGATTPISPPQRYMFSYGTPEGAGAAGGVDLAGKTPLTGGSTGVARPSPKSAFSAGAAVATPEQLQHFLDTFEVTRGSPAAAAAAGVGAASGGYGPDYSVYASGFAFPTAQEQQDAGGMMNLAMAQEAPKYRPSWLPRAKALVHQPDVISPSSEEEVEEFLWAVLNARRDWMEVWTERLREWFSQQLLQPLVEAVEGAHVEVNQVLQKYQQPTRLPPLPDVISSSSGSSTGGAAGAGGAQPAAGASSAAGGLSGGAAGDVEVIVRATQQWCSALYAPGTPRAQDAMTLATALTRYEQLLLLLRGRRPAELLPPAPSGYLWSRIKTLAQGTCMHDYNWSGGGPWAGRPWSSELPNDSSLLLYLFAAFLDAPAWEFPLQRQGEGELGRGLPLFLGQLKPRPPAQYSAILAYRIERPGKGVDALLGLNLASDNPMFVVLAEQRLIAMTGYHGLFHGVLSFLLYHKTRLNGAIGTHFLQDAALRLTPVIEPPATRNLVQHPHTLFGAWFPPAATPHHQQQPHDKVA